MILLENKITGKKSVNIWVRRFINEGKPSIILSHAFCLSSDVLGPLARALCRTGFDVWLPNMRGHGRGTYKSLVTNYEKGDYGFDSIVTEDLPFLVDSILAAGAQKKVIVAGHSIGGMSWEQYLSGVYKKDSRIYQSDKIAEQRSQKVSHFIGITVPANFNDLSLQLKSLLFSFYPAVASGRFFIPIVLDNKFSQDISFSMLKLILSNGIIEQDNISKDKNEFEYLFYHGLSSPHTDIVKDFLDWIFLSPGYKSRNGAVIYALNKRVKVPTLMVAAGKDSLSTSKQIFDSLYEKYHMDLKKHFVNLPSSSHLDVIFDKFIKKISSLLQKFVE